MRKYTRNAIILFGIGIILAFVNPFFAVISSLAIPYWLIKWGEKDYIRDIHGVET